MSDDSLLDEPFQVDGRYNQDIDRNGDRIPDRMQQGYDSSTGDPIGSDYVAPIPFGLAHVQNVPDERSYRESLASIGATYDSSVGLSRDRGARSAADAAVGRSTAVEKAIDSKPAEGPNFYEKAAARALWERRKDMPKKAPGLFENLRQIQSAGTDGKTGLEVLQTFGHGIAGGYMIGRKMSERKNEIRTYKVNEEFHLQMAREKDRDAGLANLAAVDVLSMSTPDGGGSAPEGNDPTSPPSGREPTSQGPAQSASAPAETPATINAIERGRDESGAETIGSVKNDAPSFPPQQLGAIPKRAIGEEKTATDSQVPLAAAAPKANPISVAKAPDKMATATRSASPTQTTGILAAGAALSTVAPIAAPVLAAGALNKVQKDAGNDHASAVRSTGAKGPAQRAPSVQISVRRDAKTAGRSLAPAPSNAPRRENVVDLDAARHKQGAMHQLAATLVHQESVTLSKGPAKIGTPRPGAGLGTVMATRIINSRGGFDAATLAIMREKKGTGR